jgi:hypothetical protein
MPSLGVILNCVQIRIRSKAKTRLTFLIVIHETLPPLIISPAHLAPVSQKHEKGEDEVKLFLDAQGPKMERWVHVEIVAGFGVASTLLHTISEMFRN